MLVILFLRDIETECRIVFKFAYCVLHNDIEENQYVIIVTSFRQVHRVVLNLHFIQKKKNYDIQLLLCSFFVCTFDASLYILIYLYQYHLLQSFSNRFQILTVTLKIFCVDRILSSIAFFIPINSTFS